VARPASPKGRSIPLRGSTPSKKFPPFGICKPWRVLQTVTKDYMAVFDDPNLPGIASGESELLARIAHIGEDIVAPTRRGQ